MVRRHRTLPFGRAACGFGALAVVLGATRAATAAKIACVGDSITFGYNLTDPSTQSYPAVLGMRLGSSDTVQNFGVSGATLLKSGDKPYWNEANFTASTSFAPDVVVVMLGTNDAKAQNWSNKAEFLPDYLDLIAHYRGLGALVYVAKPPPVYPPGAYDIPPDVVANEVVPLVEMIAGQASAPLVDVFTALSDKAEDFPDTVHPNAAGAALIADAVQASLDMYGLGGASPLAGAGGMGTSAGAGGALAASGTGGAPSGGNVNAGGGVPSSAGRGGGEPSAGGVPSASGTGMQGAGGSPATNGGAANAARGGSGEPAGSGAGTTSAGAAGGAGVGVAGAGASSVSASAGSGPAGATSGASGCGCRASRAGAPGGVFTALALVFSAFRRRRRQSA